MFEAAGCFPCGVGKIHQCLTLLVKNASNLERFQKHTLRFFENNFPRFSLLDAGNQAGVISPVCRQLTALSEGSDRDKLASILATWHVTPGTKGSTKLLSLISFSVNIPNDTSATSLSEQADNVTAPTAATDSVTRNRLTDDVLNDFNTAIPTFCV